ncbi:MAG: hypothetical protein WC586_07720 [Methanoregula sp.]
MSDDTGSLSLDFLVGFTIFLISLIWVLSIVPTMLIGLQAYTVDYDAVAYRTGVILVEDPGEPSSWEAAQYNEDYNKTDVLRFGLAVSRDDPNILSHDKVNRFFDTMTFDYPLDYHTRSIFGDYPYQFNVSLSETGSTGTRSIGEVLPEGYGYIRRFVKIKSMSYATIDGSDPVLLNNEGYINGDNETTHIFSILLNNTELTGKTSPIRDPAYQIIPARESFMINITDIKSTMWPDREGCFDVSLQSGDIWVSDGTSQRIFNEPVIDEVPVSLSNIPLTVHRNISIRYNTTTDRKGLNWEAPQITVYLKFTLSQSGSGCACPACPGSRFLNSTQTTPFDHPFVYNYTSKKVTQPQLKDALVEVAVW